MAVWFASFLHSKNLQLKNGMDIAIPGVLRSKTPKGQTAQRFDPRKGLEGRSSLLLAVPITGNGARQAELALRNPGKPGFLRGETKASRKKCAQTYKLNREGY
jgi:hypothetical protein